MLAALMERDASYDGLFYAAVTTTGIFCRPSCPARKPKTQNVVFYASARDALLAGFRPCQRCRPLEEPGRTPEWAARLIASVEAAPARKLRDSDLRAQGLDPAAVRRYFQASYGLTFHAYSRTRRLGAAFAALAEGKSIDEVVFDTGWDSHSGFRDAFGKATGRPPGQIASYSRRLGTGERPEAPADFLRLSWVETPMGRLIAGATTEALCLLEFPDRRMIDTQLDTLRRHFRMPLLPATSPLIDLVRSQLDEYFAGERQTFDIPLDYPGSEFQRRVWERLRSIPYGETRSYAELASEVGVPGAARAVGRANGQNRIAILIPCHRVVAADGGLGGYGGGLWRKLRLLETEGARGFGTT
jgi:AraC family transcriptional regulator of adaptative response/methylated-DNA-[protein]-cysteine methyltransferase